MTSVFAKAANQLLNTRSRVPPLINQNTNYALRQVWNALSENRDVDEVWAADNSDAGKYMIVDIDRTGGPSKPINKGASVEGPQKKGCDNCSGNSHGCVSGLLKRALMPKETKPAPKA